MTHPTDTTKMNRAVLDLMAHPELADAVLRPVATLALTEADMNVVWANAAAAQLFASAGPAQLVGPPDWAGPTFQRQLRDAARQIDGEPVVRGFRVSLAGRHEFLQGEIGRFSLADGAPAILFACADERRIRRRREHELAGDTIAALDAGSAAAIVDEYGLPIAYNEAFAALDVSPEALERLAAANAGGETVSHATIADEGGGALRAAMAVLRVQNGKRFLVHFEPADDAGEAAEPGATATAMSPLAAVEPLWPADAGTDRSGPDAADGRPAASPFEESAAGAEAGEAPSAAGGLTAVSIGLAAVAATAPWPADAPVEAQSGSDMPADGDPAAPQTDAADADQPLAVDSQTPVQEEARTEPEAPDALEAPDEPETGEAAGGETEAAPAAAFAPGQEFATAPAAIAADDATADSGAGSEDGGDEAATAAGEWQALPDTVDDDPLVWPEAGDAVAAEAAVDEGHDAPADLDDQGADNSQSGPAPAMSAPDDGAAGLEDAAPVESAGLAALAAQPARTNSIRSLLERWYRMRDNRDAAPAGETGETPAAADDAWVADENTAIDDTGLFDFADDGEATRGDAIGADIAGDSLEDADARDAIERGASRPAWTPADGAAEAYRPEAADIDEPLPEVSDAPVDADPADGSETEAFTAPEAAGTPDRTDEPRQEQVEDAAVALADAGLVAEDVARAEDGQTPEPAPVESAMVGDPAGDAATNDPDDGLQDGATGAWRPADVAAATGAGALAAATAAVVSTAGSGDAEADAMEPATPDMPPEDDKPHDTRAADDEVEPARPQFDAIDAQAPQAIAGEDGFDSDPPGESPAPQPGEAFAPTEQDDAQFASPSASAQGDFIFKAGADPVRFAWTVDDNHVFLSVSPELAAAVGPNAADVVGRRWSELARVFGFDRNGDIQRLLEKRDTWSGKTVLWPVQGTDLAVPVDLAALPAFSGARLFDGFRGFGIIRMADAVIDPDEIGLALVSGPFESRDREGAAALAIPADAISAANDPDGDLRRFRGLDDDEARPAAWFDENEPPAPANVVDFASRSRDIGEQLSSREARAFSEIGRKLGSDGDEAGLADIRPAEARRSVLAAVEPPVDPGVTAADGAGADAAHGEATPGETDERSPTTLLDQLPVPVVVYRAGETLYANPELLAATGYASVQALREAGGVAALFAGAGLSEGENASMRLSRADATKFEVRPILQRVPWAGGRALLLAFRLPQEPAGNADRVAIDAARIAELKSILDTATDGIVIANPDGLVESINGPAQALFGLSQEEAAGRPLTDLFAPESFRTISEYVREIAEPGIAGLLNDGREVIGRESKGGLIPLFVTMGRAGEAGKTCAVLRDITHWKKAEEELVSARRAAESASEQKSEFLARVSHEIRTPLNAIIGFSEVMIEERFGPIDNDRYRGYLRDINRSGVHVLDLINDLLDISKIEAGKMELTYEAVDLNQLVQETVALLQPQANAERIIIRTSLSRAVPRVVADARSIRQIILNLVSNAIKFTPANGQVIVSTVYEGNGEVVLRVRDTGRGMTEREIEQAMKPFHQINVTDERRGQGTGLGLPLTKALVEANRAYFDLESTPGEGTIAHVHFPTQRVLAD